MSGDQPRDHGGAGPARAADPPVPDAEAVAELARRQLGITDPARLAEMTDLAGLLAWIRRGVPALQRANPGEPPPSIRFDPALAARDFWTGVPPDG